MKPSQKLREWLTEFYGMPATASDAEVNSEVRSALSDGQLTGQKLVELVGGGNGDDEFDRQVKKAVDVNLAAAQWSKEGTMSDASKLILGSEGAAASSQHIRLKATSEHYSTKRAVGTHVKTGRPVRSGFFDGKQAETASEWDFARAGAWLKYLAVRDGVRGVVLDEHSRAILNESFAKDTFCGLMGTEWQTDIPGRQAKAVLDDSTSGGSYLNPAHFDESIVTYPLLYGEVTPFVDQVPVPRGSSIEGATLTAPTMLWSQAEGSAATLFTTTGLIGLIEATIFSVDCFVEVGRDALSDMPIDLGKRLVGLIGERLQEELDNQISNGDGSTEIEGIFSASGTGSVSSTNGTAGAYAVADAEQLLFGIAKQYRRPEFKPAYLASDTAYRRFCAVPISGTDQRRVMRPELDYAAYELCGYPFKIQDDIAVASSAFVALAKAYRLWRRQGAEVRWSDQGETVFRKNSALLAFRARFAGKVVDPNAVVTMTDGDSTDG